MPYQTRGNNYQTHMFSLFLALWIIRNTNTPASMFRKRDAAFSSICSNPLGFSMAMEKTTPNATRERNERQTLESLAVIFQHQRMCIMQHMGVVVTIVNMISHFPISSHQIT